MLIGFCKAKIHFPIFHFPVFHFLVFHFLVFHFLVFPLCVLHFGVYCVRQRKLLPMCFLYIGALAEWSEVSKAMKPDWLFARFIIRVKRPVNVSMNAIQHSPFQCYFSDYLSRNVSALQNHLSHEIGDRRV